MEREDGSRARLEIFLAFLKLGCVCFGGPAAHLGYFRDEFVERRRWIREATFAEFIGLTQLLPGPSSSQIGFLIGISRGGLLGGLAAWMGFTIPSALLMILFAAGISRAQGKLETGALNGLQVAAVAVVAAAVLRMFRTLCPDVTRAAVAIGTALLAVRWNGPMSQIVAILIGGAAGVIALRQKAVSDDAPVNLRVSRRAAALAFMLFAVFFGLLEAAAGSGQAGFRQLRAFYRTGSLVFGGGHVVLPLLEQAVVRTGWVDGNAFLSGYGAAQTLPGPLFAFSAYLGYISRAAPTGIPGALLCLAAIFLPGLLLAVAAAPFWQSWRRWKPAQSIFAGINAAVVGLLMTALFHAAESPALRVNANWIWAAVGFIVLAATRVSPVIVVLAIAGTTAGISLFF